MLHGIYGRGRNWQAIARALVSRRPEYACWLVDLPYHGDSPAARHGDGMAGLAADLDAWLRAEAIDPDAVLGHSLGGKVALALAGTRREPAMQVWVIDSTPEVKPPSGSAWDMLQIVRRMPARFASRDAAIEAIVDGGFSLGVAQWMATNLARDGDAFVWRLDFDRMEQLLHDFFAADLWPVVEDAGTPHVLHFVKATRSSAMSDAAASRIRALQGPRVQFHEREGGHWIHAEAPDVVTDLLAEHLP
jgi:pimeloyl-ACP methyl ester carboxylesterase